MRGQRRQAFTLFEVLLSLGIAVLLLAAVYATIGYQLQNARAGREVMERSTLSRSLFTRISADIMAASTLSDPGRYRRQQQPQGSTMTTPTTGTGTGTGTGSTTTTTTTTEPTEEEEAPVVPIGIVGSANSLNLFVTKFPGEALPGRFGEPAKVTSDLRRISYWISSEGGLCRLEAKIITSQEALTPDLPGDEQNYRIAPEVKSLEFQYFDGTSWLDEWDSNEPDPQGDGETPIGPPRAIAIKIGFLPPPLPDGTQEEELKYVRHVVIIPTGSGTTLTTLEGGTTP